MLTGTVASCGGCYLILGPIEQFFILSSVKITYGFCLLTHLTDRALEDNPVKGPYFSDKHQPEKGSMRSKVKTWVLLTSLMKPRSECCGNQSQPGSNTLVMTPPTTNLSLSQALDNPVPTTDHLLHDYSFPLSSLRSPFLPVLEALRCFCLWPMLWPYAFVFDPSLTLPL